MCRGVVERDVVGKERGPAPGGATPDREPGARAIQQADPNEPPTRATDTPRRDGGSGSR